MLVLARRALAMCSWNNLFNLCIRLQAGTSLIDTMHSYRWDNSHVIGRWYNTTFAASMITE